jgi:hypothetical protein
VTVVPDGQVRTQRMCRLVAFVPGVRAVGTCAVQPFARKSQDHVRDPLTGLGRGACLQLGDQLLNRLLSGVTGLWRPPQRD